MSNLLQLLQEVDPAISASMAADLRAALVAVNQQAQADPASGDWSLKSWWQWLEDEGYNREGFAATLHSLTVAKVGHEALTNLLAFCRSDGDEPEGLAILLARLNEIDADLIDVLHELEAQAIVEANELAQTAGGISKAGKTVLYSVAGVGVLGFITYSVYRYARGKKEIKEKAAQEFLESMKAYDQAAMQNSEDRMESEISNDSSRYETQLFDLIANDPQGALSKLKMINPDVYANRKNIATYAEEDAKARAVKLTIEHSLEFVDETIATRAYKAVENRPEFIEKVNELAEKKFGLDLSDDESSVESFVSSATEEGLNWGQAVKEASSEVTRSNWFKQQVSAATKQLEQQRLQSLYSDYLESVHKEAAEAKAHADDIVKSPNWDPALNPERIYPDMGKSLTVVRQDIRTAAQNAVSDAEATAKAAAITEETDLIEVFEA